jgi:D-alanyl-lipoteichoic acid acyltransferase DltB (MBOAT superfamily)
MSWRRWLVVAVIANLIGGAVWVISHAIVPSWIIYPIFLIIGLIRLRQGGSKGIVFLGVTALVFILVHFPFTPFGPEGSVCKESFDPCIQSLGWISMFVLPLLALVVAWLTYREAKTRSASTRPASP